MWVLLAGWCDECGVPRYNVLVAAGLCWVVPRAVLNPYGDSQDVSLLQVAGHEVAESARACSYNSVR